MRVFLCAALCVAPFASLWSQSMGLYDFVLNNYKHTEHSFDVSRVTERDLLAEGVTGYKKLYALYLVAVANNKDKDHERALTLLTSILAQQDSVDSNTFIYDVWSLKGTTFKHLGEYQKSVDVFSSLLGHPDIHPSFYAKFHKELSSLYLLMLDSEPGLHHLKRSHHYAQLANDVQRIQRARRSLAEYHLEISLDADSALYYLELHGEPDSSRMSDVISYSKLIGMYEQSQNKFNKAEQAFLSAHQTARLYKFRGFEEELSRLVLSNRVLQKKYVKERRFSILTAATLIIVFLYRNRNQIWLRVKPVFIRKKAQE